MLKVIGPMVFVLVGLIVYLMAANTKAAEIGRITFAMGMFWLVARLSDITFQLP